MQTVCCTIQRDVDVYLAIGYTRDLATAIGFNSIDRTRIEIVVLELTRNLLAHADGGRLRLEHIEDTTYGPGLVIETTDDGPGIVDVALALQDGYSTTQTLGAGLPGVKRLTDALEIETTVGVGTCVRAVKWLRPQVRRAVYGI
jgi:serine/threonine-protein kinase RsbT